jgi:hypothetical protein
MRTVRQFWRAARGLSEEALDAWVRVVAAARLGEGFEGVEAAWLLAVARGSARLFC